MNLRVWAPGAGSLVCRSGGADVALEGPDAAGWWSGPHLEPGADYGLLVDGAGPFPDPRSASQPDGVHGLSRVFDVGAFGWSDAGWAGRDARGAVTYELHVGTFTPGGTLGAAAARLPELAAVGIEMVSLMPIAPMPGERGWGYDGVSLYAIHEPYGGPAALQRFVDAAHAAGLGVTLDVVYNHLGPDGNYLARFGPYFTDAHHTPWGWAVNLDQPGSDQVRGYLIENALRWFRDFHVDALRLDAVHELHDDSPRHFLAELASAVAGLSRELGRPLSLVAESDRNDPATVTPASGSETNTGGMGLTAQWADDVHHALHTYLTGERHGYYVDFGSVEVLDHAYRHVFVHDGGYSTFRGQRWGAPVPDELDRQRFVVFASNHDQVGNRALGDRPAVTLSPGAQAASLAFVLLSPFTPLLFMGEEYGETRPFQFFTDHDEPLGSAVTRGRLAEFSTHGWEQLYGGPVEVPDPQSRATFEASRVNPGVTGWPHDQLRAWVASLIAARPRVLAPDAWERHPVGVSELEPRVVRLSGPVEVTANLSAEPVAFQGQLLAGFGDVAERDGLVHLAPNAVALSLPKET